MIKVISHHGKASEVIRHTKVQRWKQEDRLSPRGRHRSQQGGEIRLKRKTGDIATQALMPPNAQHPAKKTLLWGSWHTGRSDPLEGRLALLQNQRALSPGPSSLQVLTLEKQTHLDTDLSPWLHWRRDRAWHWHNREPLGNSK